MDKGLQQNVSATTELSATSENLSAQSEELNRIAEFFKTNGSAGVSNARKSRGPTITKCINASGGQLKKNQKNGSYIDNNSNGDSNGIEINMKDNLDSGFERF